MSASEAAEFAARLESLGYSMLWLPEAMGRDPFTHIAHLANHTTSIGFATGIANIWEVCQHVRGEAADIKVPGTSSEEVVRVLVHSGIPFDQAIWYAPERGGHVHVSYTARRANRRQTLHAPASGGYIGWTA